MITFSQLQMSEKFKIGDRVKIRKNSEFYGRWTNNPRDKEGEVISITDGAYGGAPGRPLPVRVSWGVGHIRSNVYNDGDLEFFQSPAIILTATLGDN